MTGQMRSPLRTALSLGLVALATASTAEAQQLRRMHRRTVVVSPASGGDVASGTALQSALARINPASCPGETWLLKIEPGTYDLGSSSLVMKPCVDIEGSGEEATRILGGGSSTDCITGTVVGSGNAELRRLTIESTATGDCALAISSVGQASPRISQVTAIASSDNPSFGMRVDSASARLRRVTLKASGPASMGLLVVSTSARMTLTDVTLLATGAGASTGLRVDGGEVSVYGSRMSGNTSSLQVASPGVVGVAHSQLVGPLVNTGGTIDCVGVYDSALDPVTCP